MGLTDRLNKLTKQAKDSAAEHKQQVEQALQNAAVAADRQTGGKYHDQILKAETRAEGYVENLEPPTPTQHDDKPAGGSPSSR